MKTSIDNYYKNNSLFLTSNSQILKICEHCGIPQEKLNGCNIVICGQNYHTTLNDMENNKNSYGCGRSFNWSTAKIYKIENKIKYNKVITTDDDSYRDDCDNVNYYNTIIGDCLSCYFPLLLIILVLTGLIFSIIFCSVILQDISSKHYNERNKYCNAIFNNVDDIYYLNIICLNNNNITIDEYDLKYWKNNNNTYFEKCFDEEAYDNNNNCNMYQEFDYLRIHYNANVNELCKSSDYKNTYICKQQTKVVIAEVFIIFSSIILCVFIFILLITIFDCYKYF